MSDIKILTLDTETEGLDGKLKRIAIYDGKKVSYGYTFEEIEKKIITFSKYYDVHVYIHNLDFDARKLDALFRKGNIDWYRTKKIGSKYSIITTKNYTLHDSFKIIPFSLANASKDFELEHAKLDLWEEVSKAYPNEYKDIGDFFIRCDKDDKLYLKYLGYDVISLYELIYKIMDIGGIDEKKFIKIISTASLSRYFLKNGIKGKVFETNGHNDFDMLVSHKSWSSSKKVKNTNLTYLEMEYLIRDGFFGGRTEVFISRCLNAFHYDINSLYPFTMLNEFPIDYPNFENNKKLALEIFDKWRKDKKGLGFIKAYVYIPNQFIPPLPVKLGKLTFPTGHVLGTWTYNELAYAIENCGVKLLEVHHVIHFKNTYKVFKNFVEYFYKWKEDSKRQGKKALTNFSKLILNTGYGWTVLRRDDKTCFKDIKDLTKFKDTEKFIYKNEDLGYIELWDDVRTNTIQVQIGAYVTSYARLILLDMLRKQAKKGQVYYCDTDSIVCSERLDPSDVDSFKLGKWDLEKELEEGYFIQPKVYYEKAVDKKETRKFKGVSRKVVNDFDIDFYKNLYDDIVEGKKESIIVEHNRESLPSLSVSQKRLEDANKLKVIDKKINLQQKQKRIFDYENNTSRAYYFNNIEEFNTFSFEKKEKQEQKNLFGG